MSDSSGSVSVSVRISVPLQHLSPTLLLPRSLIAVADAVAAAVAVAVAESAAVD